MGMDVLSPWLWVPRCVRCENEGRLDGAGVERVLTNRRKCPTRGKDPRPEPVDVFG